MENITNNRHKIIPIILFLLAIIAMSPIIVEEFFYWDTLETIFFNFSNIIFIAFISYLFYRNSIKVSKLCPKFNRCAFDFILILALLPDFLAITHYFSSRDLPTSIAIFFINIFFIIPLFIISSLGIFLISFVYSIHRCK